MKLSIDDQKSAIVVCALATARGAPHSAVEGELDEVQAAFDAISFKKLAERFGYTESELPVDWDDYLSADDMFIERS